MAHRVRIVAAWPDWERNGPLGGRADDAGPGTSPLWARAMRSRAALSCRRRLMRVADATSPGSQPSCADMDVGVGIGIGGVHAGAPVSRECRSMPGALSP
jgi:hypothetical protein